MTEPFNLDAVLAEREALEPFRFIFDGDTYEIAADDVDVRVLALADNGRLDTALEYLLGDEQWDRMRRTKQTLGVRAMGEILNAWTEHCQGLGLGEALRSSGSSKSTAGRSKRTSRGTTKSA